ncbi:Dihydroorotate dehydrogenase (NAD(+)), electron transfer subunit [hydrothermal vent metagenome]|uniref:Dihydroorotate dehydrogenase (NAD(+)), electron transfer subunit n=1 Tax=hydrothermal vent metagenome TaxID=652676 RepID=A0A3B1CA42_9ZZZZ
MNCTVRENKLLAEGFHYLSVEPDRPVGAITAGQFMMLQVSASTDPLLRRPMSVADFEPDGSRFGFVIQVAGRGTRLLASLAPGDVVDILGPFGAGFAIPGNGSRLWIVAGGTGVAPFIGMVNQLKEPDNTTLFLGARSNRFLLYKDFFQKAGAKVMAATEDGSEGYRGVVTGLIKCELENDDQPETIFTCGPAPMMRAVAEIAVGKGISCYASLESQMACGFGACLGCVTKIKGEDRYTTVCSKGPVFDVTEVTI